MAHFERVLEAEFMDTPYEAMAYDAMDHWEVNRAFADDLLARLAGVSGPLEVLDLGTGTAQIPIELCRRNADIRVLAIDAATSMLDVAIGNVDIAGLRERIMLSCVDAKSLPYEDERFPVVMSNSIVHHIPEPADVLRAAVRVARRGGLLFFRDLLRPVNDSELRRLVDTYAAAADEGQRKMLADSLRAALSLTEVQTLVAQVGFPTESARQTSDRHWTWTAIRPK
jgi:ubiquinone/menaquinone biosynthesis C-methylase UbiE